VKRDALFVSNRLVDANNVAKGIQKNLQAGAAEWNQSQDALERERQRFEKVCRKLDEAINLRGVHWYIHVLADAFTSVGAIVALSAGYFLGWVWLDAAMGLVGTIVILSWAYMLLRDTGSILLDRVPASSDLPVVIREGIEDGDSKITDLHIWQVGVNQFAAVISVVAHNPKTPEEYRQVFEDSRGIGPC
jgi:cation diffusion facilitator family transporter